MKKITALGVLFFCAGAAYSQTNTTDSTRIISLKEVQVNGIQKTPQQKLVSFYKANNAATLEDIMARLPELSLIRRGTYGMEPAIRSFNGGQINVQVDGMKIHGACTDKMDPVTIYIEPINLENLQVQTGGGGFINGSAIGGTLNMKMAAPAYTTAHKITGMFNSGYQTAAKSNYQSLRLNYAAAKWAVAVSGTYRSNQNYRSGRGVVIPYTQFQKANASAAVKYQQNCHTYFKADVLMDDGWNTGYAALPMDVGYAGARIAALSMHKENAAKLLYNWQVKIYGNSIRHFMDDSKRPNVIMHMDMPGWSKTYGAFSEGALRIGNKHKLLMRVDGASTFLKASMTMHQAGQPNMYMLTWPDNRRNQFGAGVTWQWQADSLWQLQVNTRADFNNSVLVSEAAKEHVAIFSTTFKKRNDVLKNIAAQISRHSGKITITAGGSYSQRMPTAAELFGFYLFNAADGHDYIGNPLLKTENALQADIAALYVHNKTRLQASAYFNSISNYILGQKNTAYSVMTIGAAGVKTYSNIKAATIAGAEATALFVPFKNAVAVSTLRYTVAADNNNNPLPFIAPLKNISSLQYQYHTFSIQLEAETAAAQKRIGKLSGEDVTPAFSLLHVRFGYVLLVVKRQVTLQAGAENIFDKNYYEHLDWKNIPRQGRNMYVQVKCSF